MLTFIWRLSSFLVRSVWKIGFVLLFLLFIATQLITGVSSLVGAAFKSVFGADTVATLADERSKKATSEAEDLRKQNADLKTQNAKATRDLDDARARNRQLTATAASVELENKALRKDAAELKARANREVTWKGKKRPLAEAVTDMAGGVSKRTRNAAAANFASIFGESVPVYGVAVIVASTAYELKVSCDNMRDMREIALQLDPSYDAGGDEKYVCGLEVPTKEEVWQMVKNSPDAAWSLAQGAYEGAVDSIPSWEGIKSGAGSTWGGIKDAGAATGTWVAESSSAAGVWVSDSADSAWQATGSAWDYMFPDDEPTAE